MVSPSRLDLGSDFAFSPNTTETEMARPVDPLKRRHE
jgi:hypothetical protein